MQELGMPVPALERRPVLNDEQIAITELYFMLGRSRPASFGSVPMAVPISEMRALYELLDLRQWYDPLEFVGWMQALDGALIQHYKEKEAKKPKKET